jgi:hypothetical protein
MSKAPSNEKALYVPMCSWLEQFLRDRYRNSKIEVYDTSQKSLADFISVKNYGPLFPPEWNSWDIHVDITGLIFTNNKAELAFIEAKDVELTLAHLSQLLGYSRVARPLYSYLLSPKGVSGSLTSLLESYGRRDILVYHEEKGKLARKIAVASWVSSTGRIDQASVIS